MRPLLISIWPPLLCALLFLCLIVFLTSHYLPLEIGSSLSLFLNMLNGAGNTAWGLSRYYDRSL